MASPVSSRRDLCALLRPMIEVAACWRRLRSCWPNPTGRMPTRSTVGFGFVRDYWVIRRPIRHQMWLHYRNPPAMPKPGSPYQSSKDWICTSRQAQRVTTATRISTHGALLPKGLMQWAYREGQLRKLVRWLKKSRLTNKRSMACCP